MKIDPALPPPAGTQLPIQTDAEPARPFEDFLDGGVPEGGVPEGGVPEGVIAHGRAFGFAELGMFGRDERGQSPAQSLLPGKIPAEFVAVPTSIENFDEPVGRTAALEPGAATSTGDPQPGPAQVLAIARARPGGSIVPTTIPDGDGVLASPEPVSIDEEVAPAAATARRVERPRQPRSEVSLIMIVQDGGVELVAAGPALDPQACIMLRRLARAILARSGLDLVKFYLNGVPLAPDSMIMIGDSHGTRSN